MKLVVKDITGADQGELEVKFPLIKDGRGTQAVHDVVTAYLAAQRMGTACTKTKGEVSGSGKKPWPQKGTGRARAGMIRSPLWRGGGVVFGPKPRDYKKKVNAKTKLLALRKAVSDRLSAGDVVIVNELKLNSHKTKEFVKALSALGLKGTTLVVTDHVDRNLALAARNVPDVDITTASTLNTYQVLLPDKLLFTRDAFQVLEGRLSKE